MHDDGSKEDLDEIRVCTSGFIWLFRASPSLGAAAAFCFNRRRSSSDVCSIEVDVETVDGDNTAFVDTKLQRVGGNDFFPTILLLLLDGGTKQ